MTTKDMKKIDIEKIAHEGTKIYEGVKSQYDPEYRGQYLAIEIESKKVYLGKTSIEALELAKKDFPAKIFYAVKIGYDFAETIAQSFVGAQPL